MIPFPIMSYKIIGTNHDNWPSFKNAFKMTKIKIFKFGPVETPFLG